MLMRQHMYMDHNWSSIAQSNVPLCSPEVLHSKINTPMTESRTTCDFAQEHLKKFRRKVSGTPETCQIVADIKRCQQQGGYGAGVRELVSCLSFLHAFSSLHTNRSSGKFALQTFQPNGSPRYTELWGL
jgi:hypothetical protein